MTPARLLVRAAVRRHLTGLPPRALVLVACSGGPDSLTLAGAVALEGRRLGRRAGAVIVDHGLQDGSAQVAARAAATCRRLRLAPVEVWQAEVRPAREAGGPEAAARAARRRVYAAALGRWDAAAILLAHTRDDQAETVLLRLARGSGARSLAAMAPIDGALHRPLLALARTTVREAGVELGVAGDAWADPHNTDPRFARARVRASALPALEHALGPGVATALARTASLLRDDADALDAWADRVRARVETTSPVPDAVAPDEVVLDAVAPDMVVLDAVALAREPAAIRRRVLRAAALGAGCPAGSLGQEHADALDALVGRWRGQGPWSLPGGVLAARRYGRLTLARARPDPDHLPD